jgi:hypothetical protein
MRRLLGSVAIAALAGCQATAPGVSAPAGGVAVAAEGDICGKGVRIAWADINDRTAFGVRCTVDPETGITTVELSSSERGASSAIDAMANAITTQAELVAALIGRLAP